MKSIFSGSAIVASALLVGSLIVTATPSIAETPSRQFPNSQTQKPLIQDLQNVPAVSDVKDAKVSTAEVASALPTSEKPTTAKPATASEEASTAVPATSYVATAYSLRGKTASGRMVAKGLIAADPRVLPLGSRVHVQAGGYSGEYLVADTGGKIRGRRIDIWIPSSREAMRFGRRTVKLTVLSYGSRGVRKSRKAKPAVTVPVVATESVQ